MRQWHAPVLPIVFIVIIEGVRAALTEGHVFCFLARSVLDFAAANAGDHTQLIDAQYKSAVGLRSWNALENLLREPYVAGTVSSTPCAEGVTEQVRMNRDACLFDRCER